MKANILRRFRAEVRARPDITPNSTVTLHEDPLRANNTRAAELLLRKIFHDRIEILRGTDGIVCGSREEAGAARLKEYTAAQEGSDDFLLSSLTRQEIETFLKSETGEVCEAYVPDTPEVRFIECLAQDFVDVRYGI